MDRPHVSVLCVTHERRAFMPWLFWNFTKQTLPNIELVLIDSSALPFPIFSTTDAAVQYRHVEANHVGQKYELALELARGEAVMLWGDDDWHHPRELEFAYHALTSPRGASAQYVGWREGHYLDIDTMRTARYQAPNKRPCASTALVRRSHARKGHFTKAVASDTEWFMQIEDAPHAIITRLIPHVMWLVHGRNMTPRLKELPWAEHANSLCDRGSVSEEEYAMLEEELGRLRARLGR